MLFAGGTVCIALLGMFTLRLTFLNGVAVAAALTVVVTVAAAVTLLPALLGVIGMRVLSRRQRRRLAANGPQHGAGRAAPRPAGRPSWNGTRAPWRWPRSAVMATLAIPALSLRLGSSDQGNNPTTTTTRKAYDLLRRRLRAGLQRSADDPRRGARRPPDRAALTGLVTHAEGDRRDRVRRPGADEAGRRASRWSQAVPTTSPQDKATSDLIDHLRDDVVPAAERGTTMRAYVGGQTAIFEDFATVLFGKLPLFIGVIIALGFVLLLFAFRSLVVPLTAAVMNLVAAAASFGVLVACFQWGWGGATAPAGPGRSTPSCRSSCCRCSSGSPWTTRSSWSAGCTRSGCTPATTPGRYGSGSPRPAG